MADASNETEWAADRKVGFAMGILLIGVVAALFFRNEPLAVTDAPTVEREDLIDSRLRDRDVAVYSDDPAASAEQTDRRWSHPEILSDFGERHEDVAVPIGAGTAPAAPPAETSTRRPADSSSRSTPVFRPPTVDAVPETGSVVRTDDFAVPEPGDDSTSADPPSADIDPQQYEDYTVRYGDTLSGIADRRLGSSARYHEIYEANRDRMESPDRLTVGATIRIPLR